MARHGFSARLRVSARLVALLWAWPAAGQAVSFTPIEPPPSDFAPAFALSADGSTVVGHDVIADPANPFGGFLPPVVWRDAGPAEVLSDDFGLRSASGIVVSGDGSRIALSGCFDPPCTFPISGPSSNGDYVYENGGFTPLTPLLPSDRGLGQITGISDDGRVIVRASSLVPSTRFVDGVASELGLTPTALSGDGRVSVGTAARTAAYAIETQSPMTLTLPSDAVMGLPTDVSFDGGVIVGSYTTDRATRAGFRWENGVATSLGDGVAPSRVSGDGSVMIGGGSIWFGLDQRVLGDFLAGLGLDLSGWSGLIGLDVSNDGRTILGLGLDPAGQFQNWVAVIPEPGTGALLAFGLAGLGARARSTTRGRSNPLARLRRHRAPSRGFAPLAGAGSHLWLDGLPTLPETERGAAAHSFRCRP